MRVWWCCRLLLSSSSSIKPCWRHFLWFSIFPQDKNLFELENVRCLTIILTNAFILYGKAGMKKMILRLIDSLTFLFWIIGYGVFPKQMLVQSEWLLIEYKGELIYYNEGLQQEIQYQEQDHGCFMFQFCRGSQRVWYVELVLYKLNCLQKHTLNIDWILLEH